MYRLLRKYKLDNTIKYVSFPVREDTKIIQKKFEKVLIFAKDYNRIENNLIRAKTNVKELILCNPFKYFITLTFNSNYDRFNLDELRIVVTQKIRHLRSLNKDLFLYYLFIPEKHKDGSWHLHGVLSSDFSFFIDINKYGFDELTCFSKFGFNNISKIESRQKVSSYILKYITKDFAFREGGKHLYFCSKGLTRPQLIDELIYYNKNLDSQFWEIKNDFSYVSYFNKNINFRDFLK